MTQDEQQHDNDNMTEGETPAKAQQIAVASEQPSQSAKCHRKQLALTEMRACPSDRAGRLGG